MEGIFKEIQKERERQDAKWGQQNHLPIEWCAILGEEKGEVDKAALETHFKYATADDYLNYRKELIQTAAVCVAMVQSLDRNQLKSIDNSEEDAPDEPLFKWED